MKAVLGAEGCSLGQGGRHRLIVTLGIKLRLSTTVAVKIVMARARLLMLPASNPVYPAVLGALMTTGHNWLNDARDLMLSLGIPSHLDAGHCDNVIALLGDGGPVCRQKAAAWWKRHVVLPAAFRFEEEWLQGQVNGCCTSPMASGDGWGSLDEAGKAPVEQGHVEVRQDLVIGQSLRAATGRSHWQA